jgi:hypothetical protein
VDEKSEKEWGLPRFFANPRLFFNFGMGSVLGSGIGGDPTGFQNQKKP